MAETIVDVSTLAVETCCNCGMRFAMPAAYQAKRRNDHGSFHCPAGHSQHYPGKSDAEKLRDELTGERARLDQAKAQLERQRAQLQHAEHSIRARKSVATKLRKRIAAGKCPCCHAAFADLRKHMKTKHPKWSPEQAANAIAGKKEP